MLYSLSGGSGPNLWNLPSKIANASCCLEEEDFHDMGNKKLNLHVPAYAIQRPRLVGGFRRA